MNLAFLALLGLYVAFAVTVNRTEPKDASKATRTVGGILHIAIFTFAVVYAARQGVFSRQLVSPVFIGAGLLAGHLIFGVSLLVTHQSWRAAAVQFVDLNPLWEYLVDNPMVSLRFIAVSVAEELIYRVTAQPLLIEAIRSPVAAILIVAAAFSVVHRHFFKNPVGQSTEFAGFAILLGVLYHWTGSAILVLVIHAVRNVEIAYLEHVVATEESEDDTPADPGGEHAGLRHTPETT